MLDPSYVCWTLETYAVYIGTVVYKRVFICTAHALHRFNGRELVIGHILCHTTAWLCARWTIDLATIIGLGYRVRGSIIGCNHAEYNDQ